MDEVEACYAEIIELSTFAKHTSQVLLIPTSSTEDGAVLETNLTRDEFQKTESLPEVPNSAKPNIPRGHCQNGPIIYKKASEIEDMSCLHYENVSVSTTTLTKSDAQQTGSIQTQGILETSFPQNVLMTSEIEYIDCFYYEALTESSISHERHEPNCVQHLSTTFLNPKTEKLTLCKRLEINRQKMRGCEFTCHAMCTVYKEVEQNAVLDVISFVLSFGVLVIGFIYLDACKVCTHIPVMLACSGIMNSIASAINAGIILKNNSRKCLCWRDIARAIRSIMLVAHIYGLVLVYEVLYPEETDKSSARYCNTYLYWLGFAYFHTFLLASVATLIAMISVSLFYLFKKNKYVFR